MTSAESPLIEAVLKASPETKDRLLMELLKELVTRTGGRPFSALDGGTATDPFDAAPVTFDHPFTPEELAELQRRAAAAGEGIPLDEFIRQMDEEED